MAVPSFPASPSRCPGDPLFVFLDAFVPEKGQERGEPDHGPSSTATRFYEVPGGDDVIVDMPAWRRILLEVA